MRRNHRLRSAYRPARSEYQQARDPFNLSDVHAATTTINLPYDEYLKLSQGCRSRNLSESRTSSTSFYYHTYSDVDIPEICAYSIANRCSFVDKGCRRLHAKCASHWQFYSKSENHWYNFREFHSKILEQNYQDPNNEVVSLAPLEPKLLDSNSRVLLRILGTDVLSANYSSMELVSGSSTFPMRRLSTHSSAISKSSIATVYEWYFKDEDENWIKFGEPNTKNMGSHVPNITSDNIESHYCSKMREPLSYESSHHKYTLDMITMTQKNLSTNTERSVRRRPKKRPIKGRFGLNTVNIRPAHWKHSTSDDVCTLVLVPNHTSEFREIKDLIAKTLPSKSIATIKRVENLDLWNDYETKKQKIIKKCKDSSCINEQRLFHGTKAENIKFIIEENLDWRLHGTNSGQSFGQGTYFSSDAKYSWSYCNQLGKKVMLVVKVIVGTYTSGNPRMMRPPCNPATGGLYDTTVNNEINPTIFVKYDQREYYPEYVVEFS